MSRRQPRTIRNQYFQKRLIIPQPITFKKMCIPVFPVDVRYVADLKAYRKECKRRYDEYKRIVSRTGTVVSNPNLHGYTSNTTDTTTVIISSEAHFYRYA